MGLRPVGQRLQLAQVLEVQGIGAADRHRNAVEGHRVALRHLVQDVEGTAARVHEVFGEHLEPVHFRALAQDRPEVDGAQADADPQVRKSPAVAHGQGMNDY